MQKSNEGIIQKAFDKTITDMSNAQIPSYTINRVIKLKQELIEKIKQEQEPFYTALAVATNQSMTEGITIKKLIGDNQ